MFVLVLFAFPVYAFAWGMLGHRIVGGIAEYYLMEKARKKIQEILGSETLAMAGNWGDFIKSDVTYKYLSSWHYINLPVGLNRDQLGDYLEKDTAQDAYTRLQFLKKELKTGNLAPATRLFYLKMLIHLAEDMSQPMHAARQADQGGNRLRVYWFNTPSNLHRVWDEQLIEYQQLSYTEYIAAINHPGKAQVRDWQAASIGQWVWDAYHLSERLYAEVESGDRLSFAYNFRNVSDLNEQLLKGGIRLAGLLNEIFEK